MSATESVFYLAVVTQVFYLVWMAKSIVFFSLSTRGRLYADVNSETKTAPEWSGHLPKITVILPARNESEAILRCNLQSLLSLDYPTKKREILLVTDSDDVATCAAANRLSKELVLTHLVVPGNKDPSWAQIMKEARGRGAKWADIEVNRLSISKPRALTYALWKSTGQIITVVDAEDIQTDPKAFRKAAECLQFEGYEAVQGKLQFINYKDSWLSLQAVGDYAYWFTWLLPRISSRGFPVALGGTSYYIRREILDNVGGWDPTNVTEDLELGLRLYGYGHRVGIVDVDTYEESPRKLLKNQHEGGWTNQRTRWVRGIFYTVSRLGRYWREFSLKRRVGIAFLLFYYLLGVFVPFLSIFGYPFMVLSFLATLLLQIRFISGFGQIAGHPIFVLLLENPWLAVLGTINMFLLLWHVFLTVRGIAKAVGKTIKGVRSKIHYYGLAASTMMFYWVLYCLPVLRAVWQFLRGAEFWEKTFHEGLHHPLLDELTRA